MQKIATKFWLNLFKMGYEFLEKIYPFNENEKSTIENIIKTIEISTKN